MGFLTQNRQKKWEIITRKTLVNGPKYFGLSYDAQGVSCTYKGRKAYVDQDIPCFIPWDEIKAVHYARGDVFMQELEKAFLAHRKDPAQIQTERIEEQRLRDQELARARRAEKDRQEAESARRKLVDEQNRKIREAEQAKAAQESERQRKVQQELNRKKRLEAEAKERTENRLRKFQE